VTPRLFAAAVLSAVAFGACSWSTTFAVANLSAGPVRIVYSRRRFITSPAVKSLRDLKNTDRPWYPVNAGFEGTDSTRVFTFTLGPDSAYRIGGGGTYMGYNDNDADWFEVAQLTIVTNAGERSYQGREVLKAFTKWSRTLFVLEYR
jgi:hypothetical protein